MLVLGIETSCDETGVALYDGTHARLLAHSLHSQIARHAPYGGVVPELASRDHIRYLIPLIEHVLAQAQVQTQQLDAIAYTKGPGLIGALLVGSSVANGLALGLSCPTVPVHHLEGHLLAPLLEDTQPSFPFLALLVSGGHSMLVKVLSIGHYEMLGDTLDDAAGEAFDKTAKLLGLAYPGGPRLEKLAAQGQADRFTFPRPMCDRPGLTMSFSGLKTHTRNLISQQAPLLETTKADIAAGFQDAMVDVLTRKVHRALKQTGLKQCVVAGGVGANQLLRHRLQELLSNIGGQLYTPKLEFCTDNGAMIALAGALRLKLGITQAPEIQARAQWPLHELSL